MADYTQPDVVNKRVRFFDGQFLQDQDFIDEQRYHLDRQRRLSRLLAVQGIVSGLVVTTDGANEVTVSPGTAVDSLGRMLVLETKLTVRLPAEQFNKQQGVELHIVYRATATEVAQTGGKSERRWDESPKVVAAAPGGAVAVAPEGASTDYSGPTVLLAALMLGDNGTVTVDAAVAQHSGLSVPGAAASGAAGSSHRIEAREGGLHFLRGEQGSGEHADVVARDVTALGDLTVAGTVTGDLWVAGRVGLGRTGQTSGCSVDWDNQGGGLHVRTHDQPGGTTRLFVGSAGGIGVGTTDPRSDLTIGGFEDDSRYLSLRAGGGEKHLSGVKLWAWQENFGCSVAYDERPDHGKGLHIRTHNRNAEGDSRLFVDFASGKVGVNAVSTGDKKLAYQLTVSAASQHLQLRREGTETPGGARVFLELFQDDSKPPQAPEVFPSIRFHHAHRFWRRIEGRADGFHFMHGDPASGDYTGIRSASLRIGSVGIGEVELGILKMVVDGILMTLGSGRQAIQAALPKAVENIALRAHYGRYVVAEDGGQLPFRANRTAVGPWETLGLVRLFGDYVALQAYNKNFVRVRSDGKLIAQRDQVGLPEIFRLEQVEKGGVALRAHTGKYVCAEGGDRELVANRDQRGPWETFQLHKV